MRMRFCCLITRATASRTAFTMAGLTCLTRLGSAARRPSAAAPDHDKSAGSLEERIIAAGHHVGHAGDADDATARQVARNFDPEFLLDCSDRRLGRPQRSVNQRPAAVACRPVSVFDLFRARSLGSEVASNAAFGN